MADLLTLYDIGYKINVGSLPGAFIELCELSGQRGDEWRAWYDDTQLVRRARLDGVIAARRGRGYAGRPNQPIPEAPPLEIGLYDLEDVSVADTDDWVGEPLDKDWKLELLRQGSGSAYQQIFSTDEVYRPPRDSRVLHGAFFEIPSPHQEEFNDWYEMEHLPIQLEVPGYLNARRLQGMTDPSAFVALYDVDELERTQNDLAAAAMRSPWGDRIRSKLARSRARRLFLIDRVVFAEKSHERPDNGDES